MCEWKSDFSHQKSLKIHGKVESIDRCLWEIVNALNESDIHTVTSCCGHGKQLGNIALADGREIIIASDFETARMIDAIFVERISGRDE